MENSAQNNLIVKLKSTEDLQTFLQEVLQMAKNEGATDACVTINQEKGFGIDVRMSEVETLAFHEARNAGVTVYFGQRQGSASSTDVSPDALISTVRAACNIAKASAQDPCFGLADRDLVDNNIPELELCHPWDIAPKEAIEQAQDCEKKAFAIDSKINNSDGVSLSTYTFCNGYADSYGRNFVSNSSMHSMSCSLIATENSTMQRDYAFTCARNNQDLASSSVVANLAGQRVLDRLGARQINTQTIPVMFSSRVSASLISSFVSAIGGSNQYRRNSFLLGAQGSQVFPKGINIYERPRIKGALGSASFDAEGVATRDNVFVADGVVNQYVMGSYSARRLGLKTTANSGGVFNLTVEPTAGDFKDLLTQMNRGFLVTEMMGQGVNILTGDYSRGACGFWVENGEIQFPVEGVTIAGNLKDMFAGIIAIGSDWDVNRATRCGSILIKKLMVAGD